MTSTPISNAARLLRECAEEIKSTCTAAGEWCSEAADDKAAYEERIAVANLLEAMPSQCLHQIQEPPTKTEALAHYSQQAILAIGEAMAVPDGWKLVPVVPTTEMGWAYLDKAREISPGDKWKFSHPGYEAALSAAPPQPASVSAPAAAAPVVLPEPVVVATSKRDSPMKGSVDFTWRVDSLKEEGEHKLYSEPQVRALLVGVSAPAAREAAAVKTLESKSFEWRGGEEWAPPIGKAPDFDLIDSLRARIAELEPQSQADARDAGRYRAVRDGVESGDRCLFIYTMKHGFGTKLTGNAADTDVDAAIAAQAAQQGGNKQ